MYKCAVACFITVLLFTLPAVAAEDDPEFTFTSSNNNSYRVETMVTGLEIPWSIVFEPDGTMLIVERVGRLRIYRNEKLIEEPLATFVDLNAYGEGGLMGLVLHPNYAQNRLLYLSFSYPKESSYVVRVARFVRGENGLANETTIIDDIPAARFHSGCRLGFGPDGKLYITTGDGLKRHLAQQLGSLAGKTLRLNDDGSVPSDNPLVGIEGARPEIWSYGHRNAQGMDWHPETGLMVQTEHGPSSFDGRPGGDEVNIVDRGKNYGWPTISHTATHDGMQSPTLEYTPAIAPASGVFYTGKLMPEFYGNYFFGALRGSRLIRVELQGRNPLKQEHWFPEVFGRIRDVAVGPEGAIYFSTSNRDGRGVARKGDDKIMRIVPASTPLRKKLKPPRDPVHAPDAEVPRQNKALSIQR